MAMETENSLIKILEKKEFSCLDIARALKGLDDPLDKAHLCHELLQLPERDCFNLLNRLSSKPFLPKNSRKGLEKRHELYMGKERKEKKRAIENASTDSLTGLLNHETFRDSSIGEIDRIRREIESGKARNIVDCFAYIDFDKFKDINDIYGHNFGDDLLRSVSKVIKNTRKSDLKGRLGGDEFGIYFVNVERQEVDNLSETISENINEAINLYLRERGIEDLRVGASTGLAIYNREREELEESEKTREILNREYDILMGNAEKAMYYANKKTDSSHEVYQPSKNHLYSRTMKNRKSR